MYFRPLLEAFAETAPADAALSPEAAAARLTAFGFIDAKRTQAAVRELTRGMNRSSRLMQQLLPLLLDWLSQAPDPDLGLLVVRNLLDNDGRRRTLAESFRDSPATARNLCTIAGTSRLLGETLQRNPDLVARLDQPDQLLTRPREALLRSADSAVQWRSDRSDRQESLRRWTAGTSSVSPHGTSSATPTSDGSEPISPFWRKPRWRARSPPSTDHPLRRARDGALRRAELAYASDLDVVFVHDGAGAAGAEEAKRLASGLMRFIGGSTPAARIYAIDADLRPEGRSGPLARSLAAFDSYWRTNALTWERQAMTRARPVAGDVDLAEELLSLIEPSVWGKGLTEDETREIRRMKARIETERIPPGEDPAFHLKLGRGSLSDIEFTAQMLQLRSGVRAPGTLDALRELTADGSLGTDDADTLAEAYEFCEQVRNRWYLVNSGPGDSLPSGNEELLWLARSLDTSPGLLRDHYQRVTDAPARSSTGSSTTCPTIAPERRLRQPAKWPRGAPAPVGTRRPRRAGWRRCRRRTGARRRCSRWPPRTRPSPRPLRGGRSSAPGRGRSPRPADAARSSSI